MNTQIDNKFSHNLSLFLINYWVFFIINFDFLHRHVAHKNPLGFIVSFGIIGVLLSLGVLRVKIYIPIKIVLIDIMSAMASFFIINMLMYPSLCHGAGCEFSKDIWIMLKLIGALITYLFFALKIYVALAVVIVIYLVIVGQTY